MKTDLHTKCPCEWMGSKQQTWFDTKMQQKECVQGLFEMGPRKGRFFGIFGAHESDLSDWGSTQIPSDFNFSKAAKPWSNFAGSLHTGPVWNDFVLLGRMFRRTETAVVLRIR
jgi:hypothetical protein